MIESKDIKINKTMAPGEKLPEKKTPPRKESADKSINLDNPQSLENKSAETKFKSDFAGSIEGNKLKTNYTKGSVEYSYEFVLNDNGTITIKRTNESEKKEKGKQNLQPLVATVTFNRINEGNVPNFPEIKQVLETCKKTPKKGDESKTVEVEVGAMIPVTGQVSTPQGFTEKDQFGVQGNLNYKLSPYLALNIPIEAQWGFITESPKDGPLILNDKIYTTVSSGLGVRGMIPLSRLTLYGTAGIKGEIIYIDKTEITRTIGPVKDSTETKFAPVVYVSAGGKLNITSGWYVFGNIQAAKNFGTATPGVQVPVYAGTGITF